MKTIEQYKADMDSFMAAAEKENLSIISTTANGNGSPNNVMKAIIGFDTFEDAEYLAKSCNGTCYSFHKKNGWPLWVRKECVSGPFDVANNLDGQTYNVDDEDELIEDLKAFIDNPNVTLAEITKKASYLNMIAEQLKSLRPGEYLIKNNNGDFSEEVYRDFVMSLSEDSDTYAIGVLQPFEEDYE